LNQNDSLNQLFGVHIPSSKRRLSDDIDQINEDIFDSQSNSLTLFSKDSEMTIVDFKKKSQLGAGAFGEVFLVENTLNIKRNNKIKKKKY